MKSLKSFIESIKKFYFRSTGYSYTNLGRLFLRLFVGIMLFQFGVRELLNFNQISESLGQVLWMDGRTALITMIVIEMVCPMFIMFGFITRLMCLPPFAAMIVTAILGSHAIEPGSIFTWQQPEYMPIMFLGILFFILLSGPGKISVDYFLSLHIIHTDNKSEDELEEV